MSLQKNQNIISLSVSFLVNQEASRPMLSMLKAQGLDLNNEDRLEISGRQRGKDLQLQLKWSRGRELEMADFLPIQHYYRKLPGERLQTAEMVGSRRWNVKCSFSIKLKRPDKCKTGSKEIKKQRKMKLQPYLYVKKVCATLQGKETLNKTYMDEAQTQLHVQLRHKLQDMSTVPQTLVCSESWIRLWAVYAMYVR